MKTGPVGPPVDVMRRALELQRAKEQPAPRVVEVKNGDQSLGPAVDVDMSGVEGGDFPPHWCLCQNPRLNDYGRCEICQQLCKDQVQYRQRANAAMDGPQSRSLVEVLDDVAKKAGPYHFDPRGWPSTPLVAPGVSLFTPPAEQPIPKGMSHKTERLAALNAGATIYVKRAAFGDSPIEAPVRLVEHTTLDCLFVIIYSRLPLAKCLVDDEPRDLIGALSQVTGGERVFSHMAMQLKSITFVQSRAEIGSYAHRFYRRNPVLTPIGDMPPTDRQKMCDGFGKAFRKQLGATSLNEVLDSRAATEEFNRLVRESDNPDQRRAQLIAREMGKPGFNGVPVFCVRDDQYVTFSFVASCTGVHQIKLDWVVIWKHECVENSSYELSWCPGSKGRHLFQVEAVQEDGVVSEDASQTHSTVLLEGSSPPRPDQTH